MSQLTISLLGAPAISVDGTPIGVDTRKAIALVAYLAFNPGIQTREALAALLWPELNQARSRAALRRTLSVLNRSGLAPWLAIDRASVGLRLDASVVLDVAAFHGHTAECSQHGHDPGAVCPRCINPLQAAGALYRDDFLSGFTLRDSVNFDDWQFFTAEGLRREYVAALDRLAEALTADGRYEQAIDQARLRLRVDPLHEAAHRRLMRLFVWAKQRNAALRQYRECVRILDEELGVPPLDETTALYEEIYGNRPLPGPDMAVSPQIGATSPSENAPSDMDRPGPAALVGREAAWSALEKALHSASDGRLMIIEGEAGIGKTALLDHFLAFSAAQGHMTLSAQCYLGESELALASIRELLREGISRPGADDRVHSLPAQWLAEASRLAPELEEALPASYEQPAKDELSAKSRFFEAINQVLGALAAGPRPACIAIDNLHWADNATLDLVGYLARRLGGRPICLVLTWRTDEFAGDELHRRIGYEAIADAGKQSVLLERLTPEDVAKLLSATGLVAAEPFDRAVARLAALSDGIPLFLIEYLELLKQSPALIDESDWALPGGIRSLLQSRLDPIGAAGRQLLAAAAVIGRSFDYETLRAASGRSEDECILALEELLDHRLVREVDGSAYDFYHDQLRDLVYVEISRARRRLLHRRVADALAGAVRRDSGEPRLLAAALAYHYAEGDRIDEAIAAYIEAAEQAASLFANREAIQHFESALALGSGEVVAIHERLGDLHMLLGEYGRARNDYGSAAARASGDQPARLEGKLGDLHHRLGSLALAWRHFETALEDKRLGNRWRCRFLAQCSLAAEQDGDHAKALALAQEALEAGKELGDPLALAEAHNILSILARHAGDTSEAVAQAQRSLAFAEQSGADAAPVAALNSLALAHASGENYGLAIVLTERALSASLARGDRHRAAALHNHLADYHHALGQDRTANERVTEAVRIFAEISADGLDLNPEIWKLVEW